MQLWISAGKETQETPQLWQGIDKKKEYKIQDKLRKRKLKQLKMFMKKRTNKKNLILT